MKFPTLIVFFLLLVAYFIPSVSAQNCTTDTRVTSGLITTPSVTGKFGVDATGKCITSNQAPFAPFKIPSYDDLKSLYFDQNKLDSTRKITLSATSIDTIDLGANSKIYYREGSFTVSDYANQVRTANTNNLNPAVIFVKNNLSIDENPVTSLAKRGVVFVVGGDVNIAPSIIQIDAVIISSGVIRTAGSTCTQNSYDASTTGALTINGSLVSLDSTKPPVFCRTLGAGNNTRAAEIINQQPKYLVILRNLFSDTLQKWSEVQ
ncbi:hypothetical protein HY383_04345 [Candidatus Daviesbacteria bacterium]|nr:hypothetical protein [Candidatus Daviesbacteria bacterium]